MIVNLDHCSRRQCNHGARHMQTDVELLTSLSDEELEALANSTLAASSQDRLDELLARKADNELDDTGQADLECLLARVDQLTIVKTRARDTLRQQAKATGA